jgi:hypothetical protein
MARQLAIEFGEDIPAYGLIDDIFPPTMPLNMKGFQNGNPLEARLDDILEDFARRHFTQPTHELAPTASTINQNAEQ